MCVNFISNTDPLCELAPPTYRIQMLKSGKTSGLIAKLGKKNS